MMIPNFYLLFFLSGAVLSLPACTLPLSSSADGGKAMITVMPAILGNLASVMPVDKRAIESAVLRYTNQERTQRGLELLQASSILNELARQHSEDMSTRGYFSHKDLEGRDPSARLQSFFPGNLSGAGENIFKYPRALQLSDDDFAKALVDGWMNSPGHRANILKADYQFIGVGIAVDASDLYATQNFN